MKIDNIKEKTKNIDDKIMELKNNKFKPNHYVTG